MSTFLCECIMRSAMHTQTLLDRISSWNACDAHGCHDDLLHEVDVVRNSSSSVLDDSLPLLAPTACTLILLAVRHLSFRPSAEKAQ